MSWYDDDEDDRRKRKRGSASYVGVSPFAGAVDHGYGPELGELSEGVGAPYAHGLSQPPSTQTQPPWLRISLPVSRRSAPTVRRTRP